MDFADQIRELAGQVDKNKDRVINEQGTKPPPAKAGGFKRTNDLTA